MNNRRITTLLFTILIQLFGIHAFACTNLIVGKKASVDGSVICSYNNDGYAFAGHMEHYGPGRHAAGEMLAVPTWLRIPTEHYITQVDYTYNMIAMMNEKQVTITETTFDGRLELVNPEGLLDYYTMMQVGLQRSATAREAIKNLTDLVAEYGYNSSGETFSICDKNEAWILEMVGKGPGRKGAVWVAMRIPDDCICAHANLSRIRQFPLKDKENCLYAKDVISFAREMGFYSGKDQDFSFRDAYCPIDFENVRYADARVWSFFRHHYDTDEMDKYLPYINGDFDKCDHLPLWIKPKEKLSVRDIMKDMRDHFEGTPLDMTADISAGPWAMPIRPLPMNFKDDEGNAYFRERPIATQQTAYTMVCHMRSWLPDEVGGVCYFNCDDADMIAYVPVYACSRKVPAAFAEENNPWPDFSEESAFWMDNFVANMVYPRYSVMIGDLRDAQRELEDYYAKAVEEDVEKTAALSSGERVHYLTEKSLQYTDMMMKRWKKLARLLITKHNDQIQLPSENGEVTGGRFGRQGYTKEYYDAIIKNTGDRYKLKKLVDRRLR